MPTLYAHGVQSQGIAINNPNAIAISIPTTCGATSDITFFIVSKFTDYQNTRVCTFTPTLPPYRVRLDTFPYQCVRFFKLGSSLLQPVSSEGIIFLTRFYPWVLQQKGFNCLFSVLSMRQWAGIYAVLSTVVCTVIGYLWPYVSPLTIHTSCVFTLWAVSGFPDCPPLKGSTVTRLARCLSFPTQAL